MGLIHDRAGLVRQESRDGGLGLRHGSDGVVHFADEIGLAETLRLTGNDIQARRSEQGALEPGGAAGVNHKVGAKQPRDGIGFLDNFDALKRPPDFGSFSRVRPYFAGMSLGSTPEFLAGLRNSRVQR